MTPEQKQRSRLLHSWSSWKSEEQSGELHAEHQTSVQQTSRHIIAHIQKPSSGKFHKQVRKGEVSLIGFDFVFRRNVRYAEVLANSAKCLWNLGAELCPDLLEEHLWGGYVTLAPCGTESSIFSAVSESCPQKFLLWTVYQMSCPFSQSMSTDSFHENYALSQRNLKVVRGHWAQDQVHNPRLTGHLKKIEKNGVKKEVSLDVVVLLPSSQ